MLGIDSQDIGLFIHASQNDILRDNTMYGHKYDFTLRSQKQPDPWLHLVHDIDNSNKVGLDLANSRDVVYITGLSNSTIDSTSHPNLGVLYCVQCDNVTVDGSGSWPDLTRSGAGVVNLVKTTNSTVKNVRSLNSDTGIKLVNSTNIDVYDNVLTNSKWAGVYVLEGGNNTIANNLITDQRYGIMMRRADSNIFSGNTIQTVSSTAPSLGNQTGIAFTSTNHPMRDNEILSNTFKDIDGWRVIDIFAGNDGQILNTLIADNNILNTRKGNAISLYPAEQGLVSGTTISNNTIDGTGGNGITLDLWDTDGVIENTSILENTIRHSGGNGISWMDWRSGNYGAIMINTLVKRNIISDNGLNGLKIEYAIDTTVSQNDIYDNTGFQVEVESDVGLDLYITDADTGNNIGNYWGRNCGKGNNAGEPLFQPGVDSNSSDVVDLYPFRHPVSRIPTFVPLKTKACPTN